MIKLANITQHLKEKIKAIPSKPGIYKMKDIDGNIMYVGKSKSLKSRVSSYFRTEHKQSKIKRMVFNIHDIDFIVTDTHLEAQLLECALIKKIKPIYNKQLKNHENYRYLKIEDYNRFKPVKIVNEREGSNCFGPYRSKNMLPEIIELFRHIYPIIKCGDTYEFTYNVLPQSIRKDTFEKNRNSLIEIFSEKDSMLKFSSQIEEKMEEEAEAFQFEKASIYRDMQGYIKYIWDNNSEEISCLNSENILMGEKIEEGYKIFYISNNRIILKRKYENITKEYIEAFLSEAKKLKYKVVSRSDEKRMVDFKYIINAEIQNKESKTMPVLDSNCNVDEFIKELLVENIND